MTNTGTTPLIEAELTRSVIGCFFRVHRELRYGFREHIYALALNQELVEAGHHVQREASVVVRYRGNPLARQKLDMVIDAKLVIEIKASERLPPNATAQLFSYLAATELEVGLLLHFAAEPNFYRVIYENRLKHRHA